jgi:probable HAF family extracellular repeat protein
MRRRYIVLVWICASIPLVSLLVFLLRPTPKARYAVTFLPDLNGVRVNAHAINDRGQVVGVAEVRPGQWHIWLWDNGAGIQDLGSFARPKRSGPLRINNVGQIAGTADDPNGSEYAFLLDLTGGRYTVRPPGGEQIHILDLNDRGRIVGYLSRNGGPRRGFVWDEGGGMQAFPPSAAESMVTGINDLGQIIGSRAAQIMGPWTVFLWDPNAGLEDLGSPGSYPATLCDINNRGFIVGRFDDNALSVRTREGPWRRLCPDRRAAVQIEGLTEANRILAVTHRQRFMMREFSRRTDLDSYVWDANDGFLEIAPRLGRKDVFEFFATGINDQGQIVGSLRLKNEPNPFGVVLTPITGARR